MKNRTVDTDGVKGTGFGKQMVTYAKVVKAV